MILPNLFLLAMIIELFAFILLSFLLQELDKRKWSRVNVTCHYCDSDNVELLEVGTDNAIFECHDCALYFEIGDV